MSEQELINYLLGGVLAVFGWWAKGLQSSLAALRDADNALTSKVSAIEVLVIGEYVKRSELEKLTEAIFAKLDRIEDKLDSKVDRSTVETMHRGERV